MSILTNLFSGGAADLVKGVGGVIDNLHTSKEEKLAAEQKIKELVASYEVEMEKQITDRLIKQSEGFPISNTIPTQNEVRKVILKLNDNKKSPDADREIFKTACEDETTFQNV